MNKISRKNLLGQGLMELIISIGIIILVLITIISLTIINLSTQRATQQRMQAIQFVREGVEAVRNLRDTIDWLSSNNANIVSSNYNNHFFSVDFNNATNRYSLTSITNNFQLLYLHPGTSAYINHSSAGGTATPFSRLITIDYICSLAGDCGGDGICSDGQGVCGDSNGDTIPDVIGYRVNSSVNWKEKNRNLNYYLVDDMYLWR